MKNKFPNFDIEFSLQKPVIGIDEVGRGLLAGPVVSCACVFLNYKIDKSILENFNDSKKLTRKKRSDAIKLIKLLKKHKKINYAIGSASVKEIDSTNILEATKISMKRAVKKLNYHKGNLIIDGKIDLKLNQYSYRGIIKGDEKSYTIAAASIIAKIYRDNYMRRLSIKYPQYGWEKNAGYGTKNHIIIIKEKGVTKHHRKSFEPIKSLIHK
tara:strand:- start:128 stop:763 length:636 start_codon:yes stop_codon:yes gene_type:complete